MTPQERAKKLIDESFQGPIPAPPPGMSMAYSYLATFAAAFEAAVAEEREACAKVADNHHAAACYGIHDAGPIRLLKEVVEAIRARSST